MIRSRATRPPSARRALSIVVAGCLAVAGTLSASAPVRGAEAAPTAAPEFSEQVLFNRGEGGYFCFRIPAIVRATDGTLLAFAEGRVVDCGDDGDIDLVVKRSSDGGRTWSPVQLVSHGNGGTHGNPMPIVDERTGRIVLFSTHNWPEPCPDGCDRDPYLQISDDHGVTWTAPREMTELKRPEWNHWYATGPVHAIQLTRGPHAGRLVMSANHETRVGTGPHVYGVHLAYSDDGGDTWRIGASADRSDGVVKVNESTLVELTDGRIYVNVREAGSAPGHRAYAISSDSGDSFDSPFQMLPELSVPVVQASTLRLTATDQGDAADRILFSAPANPATREAMSVRSSYDEAESWENWQEGKIVHWGQSAYSDMVKIGTGPAAGNRIGLLYEAGVASPYETIRFARFNEAYLDTPNGDPPGFPDPPAPGPTTPDISPHDNTAYVRGGAALTDGRFDKALSLDRVDDRVEVPFTNALDLGSGDFTLTAWFRYGETTGSHTIMWLYRMGSGTTPQIWLRAEPASNRLRALMGTEEGSATVTSAGSYNDGAWHHVALQRSAGQFVLWVDGQRVASVPAPLGSVTAGKEFGIDGIHIGQRVDGADRFRGTLDGVRVYARALTAEEIRLITEQNTPIGGRLALSLPFDTITPQ